MTPGVLLLVCLPCYRSATSSSVRKGPDPGRSLEPLDGVIWRSIRARFKVLTPAETLAL
jgi:hypothetical protein